MTEQRNDSADRGIDYFNRGHWLSNIQARMSLEARRRMFRIFLAYAGAVGGRSVLDVGATPDTERADSNCMIPWFAEAGMRVSVYSPEDVSHLKRTFGYINVLPRAGFRDPIPTPDRCVDWASASAVIEHVGSRREQVAFVRECSRVANGLFITTPNKYHWLEFHTKLPLIHWLPPAIHRRILTGMGLDTWAREEHLNLIGARDLAWIARQAIDADFSWTVRTVWALGMPSNLILLARRQAAQ